MAKKILIVDDEPDILDVTALRLSSFGYVVVTAHDGEEGLIVADKENPDLVLLDLALPRMSGYDVCRSLRTQEKFKKTPVILFTASVTDLKLSDKVKSVGANDSISKPFDPQELLKKVKKYLPD